MPPPAAASAASVLQHHNRSTRDGVFVERTLAFPAVRALKADRRFLGLVDGPVYAQPLFLSAADGAPDAIDLLFVVTGNNSVYALNARTGGQVWKRNLGPPVPPSKLPCGNPDAIGIVGTPVIDFESRAIVLNALVAGGGPPSAGAGGPKHLIYALSIDDGAVIPRWPIDVGEALKTRGRTFLPDGQVQAGALAVLDHTVYIPYGINPGKSCAPGRGFILGVPIAHPEALGVWESPGEGAGVWAPGGLTAAAGSIWIATASPRSFLASSASLAEGSLPEVLRLGLNLLPSGSAGDLFSLLGIGETETFAKREVEWGGVTPLPISISGGYTPQVLMVLGGDGQAYGLDPVGMSGKASGSSPALKVSSSAISGAPAFFSRPGEGAAHLFLVGEDSHCASGGLPPEPSGRGKDLIALGLHGGGADASVLSSIEKTWCAHGSGTGSPILTSPDGKGDFAVWSLGAEGDQKLRAFDALTGERLFDGGGPEDAVKERIARHQSPIAANGRIYVAADGRIYAFRPE